MTQTATRSAETPAFVGQSVPRREDAALITGPGHVDRRHHPAGHAPHGGACAARSRTPGSSAIDTAAARALPGVVAVFTGEDLAGEFAVGLPCGWPVTEDIKVPDHPPLARGEVNHVGDGVAVVLATDRAHGAGRARARRGRLRGAARGRRHRGGARAGLPARARGAGHQPLLHLAAAVGDVDAAFAQADVVVEGRYLQQRVLPSPMEPRAVVVEPGPGRRRRSPSTPPPRCRTSCATSLAADLRDVRQRSCGSSPRTSAAGSASKLNVYAEEALALALARRLGKPVKWTETRSEHHVATTHGRGQVQHIAVAATREGKILGMRVELLADMGAYLQLLTPGIAVFGAFTYCGLYDFGAYSFECKGVFTNLTPTDAYRGAGRSEAAYAHERIMDDLARELGMDPAEVRLRNLHPAVLRAARRAVRACCTTPATTRPACAGRWSSSATTSCAPSSAAAASRATPVQIGIGIGNFTESGGLSPSKVAAGVRLQSGGWEHATVRMTVAGKVEVVTGTSPHGQGHETAWSQIVADALGVHPDDVEVLHGDTAIAPSAATPTARAASPVGGIAVHLAAGKVVGQGATIAAHLLEAAEDDLEFGGGRFSVAGTSGAGHDDPGGRAARRPGREPARGHGAATSPPTHRFDPPNFTWPFGTHICVVEVDTETGQVEIRRYVAVDDCGAVVNPAIVEGQLHGGIAQGIGAGALRGGRVTTRRATRRRPTLADYTIPDRDRPAELRAGPDRHAVADEPDGGEGDRRVRRDRLLARRW